MIAMDIHKWKAGAMISIKEVRTVRCSLVNVPKDSERVHGRIRLEPKSAPVSLSVTHIHTHTHTHFLYA